MTYSNATHLSEVVVDVFTGAISVPRYLVVEDCGTVFNPLIVAGQQHGAIAMGISGVLLEEIVCENNGQNSSGSFADYMLATAAEIPPIEVISRHTPNRRTPTGSKGMAEGSVMGAIGAVKNAVNDALRPFEVVADRQPLSPQYIRSLVRGNIRQGRRVDAFRLRNERLGSRDLRRRGGERGVGAIPVARNVAPAGNPHAVVLRDVVEEADQRASASGPADQTAMQAH